MPTVDALALERQAIRLVEQLVGKFGLIEGLLKDKCMKQLVQFYREFNKEVITSTKEESLSMLGYVVAHGDENLALFEFKRKNGEKSDVPENLKLREEHKYDLYSRFDAIVFNECISSIGVEENGVQEGKAIEIDWSQIDTSAFTIEAAEGEA